MAPCQRVEALQRDRTVTLLPLRGKQVKHFVLHLFPRPLQNVNVCSQGEEWVTFANMMSASQIKKKKEGHSTINAVCVHRWLWFMESTVLWGSCNISLFRENRRSLRVCAHSIYTCTLFFPAQYSSWQLSPSAKLALELLNCNVIGFTCKATTMNY